jgi:predicted DNA binding protein
MSVIATFSVRSENFPLGKCIENQADAEIEIERIVPMKRGTFPYIFVWNCTDYDIFEQVVESLPEIESMTVTESFDNGRLYKLAWVDGLCPLMENILENEGIILSARGDSTEWVFELRFPERDNTSQFFTNVQCRDEIAIELRSLFEEVEFESIEEQSVLTGKQEYAIKTALEMGYFNVPREVKLSEIADALGTTPASASSLLRRGCKRILEVNFNGN